MNNPSTSDTASQEPNIPYINVEGDKINLIDLKRKIDWEKLELNLGINPEQLDLNKAIYRTYIALLVLIYNDSDEVKNQNDKILLVHKKITNPKEYSDGIYYYLFAINRNLITDIKIDELQKLNTYIETNDLTKFFKTNCELVIKKEENKDFKFGSMHNVINTNSFESII